MSFFDQTGSEKLILKTTKKLIKKQQKNIMITMKKVAKEIKKTIKIIKIIKISKNIFLMKIFFFFRMEKVMKIIYQKKILRKVEKKR